MEPTFFETPSDFRKWLERNHDSKTELLVGFYKVGSGKPSISWPESVDQALCFGWIDGVRKSIDSESYSIRFTPRKPTSIWSAVNIGKMEELTKAGLMRPEGEKAFAKRTEARSNIYSHETESVAFDAELEERFRQNEKAWAFFSAQPPSYRKVITHWVISAKQDKTRRSRLEKAIAESEKGKRLQ
ncbi:YdeI/OmpD-associated family protein [Flavobacterium selenitireducens]|uniref:YdeI/OmpD-associated family protein n=1 Tax=Flavobacterium selenitireducens TaxID=2722704 RepID=UPI00168BF23B|nr:YdeI/OmpD-associated family protein [Flavobacterium selenitireducens]MBD3583992.1 bacteriocin-protection protein [Flavobacterium selenitireducens]